MEHELVDGRLLLKRTEGERKPLLQRLGRIEGQVRGLQQMLEQNRYCLDELQQANAIVAAMREVAVLIATQHLEAGVDHAIAAEDHGALLNEMKAVLRAALRQG